MANKFKNWVRDVFGGKEKGPTGPPGSGYSTLDRLLESTPTYKIPEEAIALQKLYSETAEGIRGVGEEQQDIYGARAGQYMYGTGEAREGIREATRYGVQDIQNVAGSSASFLGAISQLNQQSVNALRELAIQNQQYRDVAQRDYMQSIQDRISLESQATELEMSGMQNMIDEKYKVYQSELDKIRMKQQYAIVKGGNVLASS
jgi:hypothetical protein